MKNFIFWVMTAILFSVLGHLSTHLDSAKQYCPFSSNEVDSCCKTDTNTSCVEYSVHDDKYWEILKNEIKNKDTSEDIKESMLRTVEIIERFVR